MTPNIESLRLRHEDVHCNLFPPFEGNIYIYIYLIEYYAALKHGSYEDYSKPR